MLKKLIAKFRKHNFEIDKEALKELSFAEVADFYTIETCQACGKKIKYHLLNFQEYKNHRKLRGCPGDKSD